MHTDLKEYVWGICLQKILLEFSGPLMSDAFASSQQVKGLVLEQQEYQPRLHWWHLAAILESLLPLQGVPLGDCWLQPGELKGSHFQPLFIGLQESWISHRNFPFYPQFGLVTFFDNLTTTSITSSTWTVIRARKRTFQGCSLKNRSSLESTSSWDQAVFLIHQRGA